MCNYNHKLQTHIDQERKGIFSVYNNTRGDIEEGDYVSFNHFFTNHGNTFDLETGTFKVPFNGVYEFSFFTMYHCVYFRCAKVAVEVNDKEILSFFAYKDKIGDGHTATLSHGWILDLNKEDKVRLKVKEGAIVIYKDSYTTFNGKCIKYL